MDKEAQNRFIDSWGAMGSAWGISPSVARVHGLLLVADRPWCLDEIAERLQISKSNVSMSLKELRAWRVVHRVLVPGDRREFYVSEADVWKMLLDILRERKRREFDPILESVRRVLGEVGNAGKDPAGDRLRRLEQMLGTFDRVAERLVSQRQSIQVLAAKWLGKP